MCSRWLFLFHLGVPQGPSVLFLGYDAEYQNITYYVTMAVHVNTIDIKGDPITSSHSKFLSARHTWVRWQSDNPNARMHRSDANALKHTLVAKQICGWRAYIRAQAKMRTTQRMVSYEGRGVYRGSNRSRHRLWRAGPRHLEAQITIRLESILPPTPQV